VFLEYARLSIRQRHLSSTKPLPGSRLRDLVAYNVDLDASA
jgi:hypothetical protein